MHNELRGHNEDDFEVDAHARKQMKELFPNEADELAKLKIEIPIMTKRLEYLGADDSPVIDHELLEEQAELQSDLDRVNLRRAELENLIAVRNKLQGKDIETEASELGEIG